MHSHAMLLYSTLKLIKTNLEQSTVLTANCKAMKQVHQRKAGIYKMSVKLGAVSSNNFTSHLRSRRPVFAVISRTGPTYTAIRPIHPCPSAKVSQVNDVYIRITP